VQKGDPLLKKKTSKEKALKGIRSHLRRKELTEQLRVSEGGKGKEGSSQPHRYSLEGQAILFLIRNFRVSNKQVRNIHQKL